ncbi:MAG: hypothetical protein BGO39_24435 [Chloroflexi bacterium 54-19]|nr:MAG: hypothetical protein BGO39_24435 [Chloroflexi bacterium 54-19]
MKGERKMHPIQLLRITLGFRCGLPVIANEQVVETFPAGQLVQAQASATMLNAALPEDDRGLVFYSFEYIWPDQYPHSVTRKHSGKGIVKRGG